MTVRIIMGFMLVGHVLIVCVGHKFKTLVCAVLCKIVRNYLIWSKHILPMILFCVTL